VPKRLLHGLDPSLDEDDRVLEIPQHLSEVDAQLYYWLMDLLLETASYSEQNLMDAKNIGTYTLCSALSLSLSQFIRSLLGFLRIPLY